MSESTSRYGIIDEMSQRKISIQEQLGNLKKNHGTKMLTLTKKINELKSLLAYKESSYISEHEMSKQEKLANLEIKKSEMQREIDNLNREIAKEEETYESKYLSWKESVENNIKTLEEQKKNDEENFKFDVESKDKMIKEIDKGISSLKEISAQSKD